MKNFSHFVGGATVLNVVGIASFMQGHKALGYAKESGKDQREEK